MLDQISKEFEETKDVNSILRRRLAEMMNSLLSDLVSKDQEECFVCFALCDKDFGLCCLFPFHTYFFHAKYIFLCVVK